MRHLFTFMLVKGMLKGQKPEPMSICRKRDGLYNVIYVTALLFSLWQLWLVGEWEA